MSTEFILAWDIGGAHLKAAYLNKNGKVIKTHQWATPIWKGFVSFDLAMKEAINIFGGLKNTRQVATTTAELVDIFSNREEGIKALSKKMSSNEANILFYAGDDGFIKSNETSKYANQIASANWHATTSFVASKIDSGVMMDVGSTTTDIIPFQMGKVTNMGYSDHERLATGELVYSGMVRTPVMAMVRQLHYRAKCFPVMAEYFANAADVHRINGLLNENDDYVETADGADKTLDASARRLARMIGVDFDVNTELDDIKLMAEEILMQQLDDMESALKKNLSRMIESTSPELVGAGCGRALIKRLADRVGLSYRDFESLIDAESDQSMMAANCATAVSLAYIARHLA